MFRILASVRPRAALALIILIYAVPAYGRGDAAAPVKTEPPVVPVSGPAPDECSSRRVKLRDEAISVLDLSPGTDLRKPSTYKAVIEKYCKRSATAPVNNRNRRAGEGVCESTYKQILALITSADFRIEAACEAIGAAKKKSDSCLNGQTECYRLAAAAFRNAAGQLGIARKTGSTVKEMLLKQVALHNEASGAYASHLEIIANEVEKYNLEQRVAKEAAPMTYQAPTASLRRRIINERVRQRLNRSALETEGVDDFEKMLTDSGLSVQDPAAIRTRVASIRKHIGSTVTGNGEADPLVQFGPWSGEQFGARGRVQEFLPVWERTEQKLGRGMEWLERSAEELESRVRLADSAPQPRPTPQRPDPFGVDQPPSRVAAATQIRPEASGSSLPFFSAGSSLPGAGTAPAQKAVPSDEYRPGAPGRAPAAAPARAGGRRLALAPGEATSLAGKLERPVSRQEKEHDEARQPETFAGNLERATADGIIPVPFGGLLASSGAVSPAGSRVTDSAGTALPAPEAAGGASAPGTPLSLSPNAETFAERQVTQMEQGRRFSPSLRDQLKRRLASQFEKGQGHARAAADLFEEIRRNTSDAGDAIAREEQMAAIDTQAETLFARVHSAHRRVAAKAKVAFH